MIKVNISNIRKRICSVCSKTKRNPREITIVAVSKGRSLEQIKQAVEEGIADIAENRVQEALLKYRQLSAMSPKLSTIQWHMVGHLQSNKVKEAVQIFDLIQSVDSLHLAEEIDKQASKISKIQDILIEIKTSPEATKFGLEPEESVSAIKEISLFKNINIKGLFTVAPPVDDPEEARSYFRMLSGLKEEFNALRAMSCKLEVLSMGMSDDFEAAIHEGSNMVRLGRAIFG